MSDDLATIPGDYIAGLVDGEGCFWLKFVRDYHRRPGKEVYTYWKIGFSIVMRQDEEELLKQVQSTLAVGKIYFIGGRNVMFQVHRLEELSRVVMPFFEQYQLRGKKREDFLLWSAALEVLLRHRGGGPGRSRPPADSQRLLEIRNEMRVFKSKRPEDYLHYPESLRTENLVLPTG